jgi:hypothetical protein
MAIGLINKLYINVARMAINKKETSYIIAFRFCRVLEDYL